jgi:hypothetical protein
MPDTLPTQRSLTADTSYIAGTIYEGKMCVNRKNSFPQIHSHYLYEGIHELKT